MLHLEELKEDRMKLMVIVDKIYSGHCAKNSSDCESCGNLAYVNATHNLYNTNDYEDEDMIKHYRWLEEKVLVSILISIDKLIKAKKLKPLEYSTTELTYNNELLEEFIFTAIDIISVQNYEEVKSYL